VFAASDVQAFGVVEVARGLGVDVPEHLSVIGFDDIEIASYVGLTARKKGGPLRPYICSDPLLER
jgi:DNA-binding LacI/PurR family transcriptional regulator